MNQWLNSLPIRAKLLLLVCLASGLALLAESVILAFNSYKGGKLALVQRVQSEADIAAVNSTAALTFDDQEAATHTLDALSADRAIVAAAIYHEGGKKLVARAFARNRPANNNDLIHVKADIVLEQRIGTIHLWASPEELHSIVKHNAVVQLCVLMLGIGLALLAALLIQRIISRPIIELASAAAVVTRTRDYSLRVPESTSDEVGQLVRTFNQMLEQIESSSHQLVDYHNKLERTVAERTAQLAKALEAAEQAARAKADFLANMSHEIRTPMNGVIGMLDLVQTESLGSEARSMIDTARGAADSLLIVINDVLDFSKIDAGKMTLETIDFELRTLIEEIAVLFTKQAHAKGVEIACVVHNDVPTLVACDPTRLRQILVNLVGNAVKFTERGEVFIGVQARPPQEGGPSDQSMIQIVVRDTGIGISAETRATLFEAFTQADTSTTRKYGGTGLGLAISKRLTNAMGGTIKVGSELGQGTTFSVFIPMLVRSHEQPLRAASAAGLRVLIVDDNSTNRCILEHYVTHEGSMPLSVPSGAAGLLALHQAVDTGEPFDVVLLDYQMPEMNGMEFLRKVRADSRIADTKCIVLSSLGEQAQDAQAMKVIAWLAKPVRRKQLENVLARAAGRRTEEAPVSTGHETQGVRFSRANVLLVEDNRVNQDVALRLLKTFGIHAQLAVDGSEAVARIRESNFDLVLMDCQMPGMDGYEATRTVRVMEELHERKRMPIAAMTANAMEGDRERCIEAGMDDYISKPIKRDVLGGLLSRWLSESTTAEVPTLSETQADAPIDSTRVDQMLENFVATPPFSPFEETGVLDSLAFAQLSEVMGDELNDVLRAYLTDTPLQFDAMGDAITRNDCSVLFRCAHSVKSSSQSVGAIGVAQLAAMLEKHARTTASGLEVDRLLAALRSSFELVEPRLQDVVAREASGRPATAHS